MRRLISAWVIVVAVGLALPAVAAERVQASIEGATQGESVRGVVPLGASASSPSGVKRLQLFVDDRLAAERTPQDYRREVSLPYDWDTRRALDSGDPAANGRYTLRAVALGNDGDEDTATVEVDVNNPPARPSGLRVRVTRGRVLLSWDANREPDLLRYGVERSRGQGFRRIAEPAGETHADSPGKGVFSYRVFAVRSGARSGEVASPPSSPVRASIRQGAGSAGTAGGKPGGGVKPQAFRGGERFGLTGLPAGVAAPGVRLPPVSPGTGEGWGTYEDRLPYDLRSETGGEEGLALAATKVLSLIPPDAVRWVAAGLLFLVTAGLLRLLALGAPL